MPKPTDERIAAALAQGARIADIATLIADVEIEIALAGSNASRLEALSLAPETVEADADEAADRGIKERRRVARLQAKVETLRARIKEIEESNRSRAKREARDAALERRDKLAIDLKTRWPKITGEMVALFERIEASDAECEKHGIDSAEAIARNCHPNFVLPGLHQYIPRLGSLKVLFSLDASTSQAITYGIWPKREPSYFP